MSKYKQLKKRVEELEAQLEENMVEADIYVPAPDWHPFGGGFREGHELTIAGKVDAILEHLGIEVDVQQKKCTGPTVKVTKIKKGKK